MDLAFATIFCMWAHGGGREAAVTDEAEMETCDSSEELSGEAYFPHSCNQLTWFF